VNSKSSCDSIDMGWPSFPDVIAARCQTCEPRNDVVKNLLMMLPAKVMYMKTCMGVSMESLGQPRWLPRRLAAVYHRASNAGVSSTLRRIEPP